MIIKDEISKKKNDFTILCKNHKVKYLYAFGSSVSDRFDPDKSDIDLLIEIDAKDPIEKGEELLSLWDLFETKSGSSYRVFHSESFPEKKYRFIKSLNL